MKLEKRRSLKVKPSQWRGIVTSGNQRRSTSRIGIGTSTDSSSLCWTPQDPVGAAAQDTEVATERARVSEAVPQDTPEKVEHPSMDSDSSGEALGSPPLLIQIPPSPSPLDQICAPSRAAAATSGRFDHLLYDRLHELRKQ